MKYELLDHDHSEIEGLMAEFFHRLEAGDPMQCHHTLDLLWARLAVHIRAEHLHLFRVLLHEAEQSDPAAAARSRPRLETVRETLAHLRREHDVFMHDIWAVLKQLRSLHLPADGRMSAEARHDIREKVEAISRHLHAHNRREETEVYRWADEWLAPAERADLNEKMKAELAHMPPRIHE